MQIPFFRELANVRAPLVMGCGGGLDFVSGFPLVSWLASQGKRVTVGNVSFQRVDLVCHEPVGPVGWIVDEACGMTSYFPEKVLRPWLQERGLAQDVVVFSKAGVQMVRESLQAAIDRFGCDAIILVDGGTDSVIRGDEPDLATAEEDVISLVAAEMTTVPVKMLACLGFGIDAYHGISHHCFLENTAQVMRAGGFKGCVSVEAETDEGRVFLEAVDYLRREHPKCQSIIATSIASAMRGEFGDVHGTERTKGSELYINPLMTSYWTYDVAKLVGIMGFAEALRQTRTFPQAEGVIHAHNGRIVRRDWKPLPY